MPLAGFGRRLWARIIDYFLLSVLVFLLGFGILFLVFLAYPGLEETSDTFDATFGFLFLFGWGLASFLYDWFFLAATGRTPGKIMTRLRVISATGTPLSQGQSALRSAVFGFWPMGSGWLARHPGISVVIDLHRDAVRQDRPFLLLTERVQVTGCSL